MIKYLPLAALAVIAPAQAAVIQYDFRYDYFLADKPDPSRLRDVSHTLTIDTAAKQLIGFSSKIHNGSLFGYGAPVSMPLNISLSDQVDDILCTLDTFQLPDDYWGQFGEGALPTFSFAWLVPKLTGADPLASLDTSAHQLQFLYGQHRVEIYGTLTSASKTVLVPDAAEVPEPAPVALLALGLTGLLLRRRS